VLTQRPEDLLPLFDIEKHRCVTPLASLRLE
jgi:hypothetical protein